MKLLILALLVGGTASVAAGVALVFPPAAFVVVGVLALVAGLDLLGRAPRGDA